ncbi:MAG: response regulator [Pyrinomonadaceae bacterium]
MTKPKLLLADDSVTIRKVVELTFADEGIDVTTVADAQSAMQRFVDIQPDIVLVDVGLDGTNGYQICEMIKADEATTHIPVLLLVGSFEPFDEAEAARVHANGHLTKPFHSIRDLVARVWELLGRDAAANEETSQETQSQEPPVESELPPVPTFGDAFTEDLSDVTDEAEPDDIEELYRSSFADTLETEKFGTVENEFDDSGFDDEMIETKQHDAQPAQSFADILSESETSDEVKEFDWSPESLVTRSESSEEEKSSFEPKFTFDDTDDASDAPAPEDEVREIKPEPEIPDTTEPTEEEIWLAGTAASPETPASDVANMDTIEIGHAPEMMGDYRFVPADKADDEGDDDVQLFDDIDFTRSNTGAPGAEISLERVSDETEDDLPEIAEEQDNEPSPEEEFESISDDLEVAEADEPAIETSEEDIDPAIHDTIPYEPGEQPPVPAVEPEPEYFSPELIERIAQRVIERLSDTAVREVAKQEVPRIAEKLIREALEHEKKS